MSGALFISYSHADRNWMHALRVHLEGALRNRDIEVWTDRDISPGSTWQSVLEHALAGARSALVLASPEYLVSDWCRRELKDLADRRRKGQVDRIYWVLLRPCAWAWTELQEQQAVQEPAMVSVESVREGPEREQFMLDLAAKIARDLIDRSQREDPTFALVYGLLKSAEKHTLYRPTKELGKGSSDFAVVMQGLDPQDRDVVIKVLTNTPLHRLRDLFKQMALARKGLSDPAFIRLRDVFSAGTGRDERIVIVGGLAENVTLASLIHKDDRDEPLDMETTGRILRSVAVALGKLHRLPPIEDAEPYRHVMGPLIPEAIFWDEKARMPQMTLVGVTAFLWHFFDPDTFQRIVQPRAGHYVAPEKRRNEPVTPLVDQYFLGMLGLQLLEGRPIFNEPDAEPMAALAASTLPWKRNTQLVALLTRLLDSRPERRFASMEEVSEHLAALEEPHRVLAKYAFTRWIEPAGVAFSQDFYDAFFALDPRALEIFRHAPPGAQHHAKLIASLVAVLNHRRGNAPTSLQHLLVRHGPLGIGAAQLLNFRDAFLSTLLARCSADPECGAIVGAWTRLFGPVLDEMARELGVAGWPPALPEPAATPPR